MNVSTILVFSYRATWYITHRLKNRNWQNVLNYFGLYKLYYKSILQLITWIQVGVQSIAMISVSVCLSVCLSVCMSAPTPQKPHVQRSPNCPYMLPVAVARSFSDGSAMRCLLPVLWMTLWFHIMARMGQNQRWRRSVRWVAAPEAKSAVSHYLLSV